MYTSMSAISDTEIRLIFKFKDTADGHEKKLYPMQLVVSKKGSG